MFRSASASTAGDLYTLWAPRWHDAGDDWEAFLGKDEDLFAFTSAADLAAFVRSDNDNDLTDHPAWERLTSASAHKLDPGTDRQFDLISVEELLAEKPTAESVQTLAGTLAVVSSIGSVCELPAVTKLFNGNPALATVNGGIEEFSGKAGLKRWNNIAAIVGRSWDSVVAAIDEIVSTPEVDTKLSEKAAEELAEPAPEEDDEPAVAAWSTPMPMPMRMRRDRAGRRCGRDRDGRRYRPGWRRGFLAQGRHRPGPADDQLRNLLHAALLHGGQADLPRPQWARSACSARERALARYLADEHDHDLSDLSTYDDIRTAANDGSLDVDITEENVYVLNSLADDISDGPDTVDRDQLELAVEFLRDLGDYSEEDTVDKALAADRPLGKFVNYVLEGSTTKPAAPYASVVSEFEDLERFVESRLRRE